MLGLGKLTEPAMAIVPLGAGRLSVDAWRQERLHRLQRS